MGQLELLPKYLAMRDLSMTDAITLVDYVESTGLYDKFKPLVSSYTMKTDNISENRKTNLNENKVLDEGGAPKVENPENDNTDASQNDGSSDARNEG